MERQEGSDNQRLSTLVIQPLTKYHRLFGKGGYVSTHENTEYHKTAVVQAAEFRHKMKSGVDILKHIDQSRNDEAVHNVQEHFNAKPFYFVEDTISLFEVIAMMGH